MTTPRPPTPLRVRVSHAIHARLAPLRRPMTQEPHFRQHQRLIEGIGLTVIFLLALGLRVFYNLTVARNYVPIHDAADYNAMAIHLLNEGCLCITPHVPTTVRPPLFPLFLAGVYLLTGADPLHARLALSVVGAGTCVLTALIAREVAGGRAGLLAGLIAATYPQLFIWDAWLYSESLAIFFFAACCLIALRLTRPLFDTLTTLASCPPPPVGEGEPRPKQQPETQRSDVVNDHPLNGPALALANLRRDGWRWLAAGVLFGLAALARPNGVYALLALIGYLCLIALARRDLWRALRAKPLVFAQRFWRDRLLQQTAWRAALLLVGCALALAPWVARNAVVTGGAFVPFTTVDGIVIAGSYNDIAYRDPYYAGEWVNPNLVPAYAPTVARYPAVCDARCEVSRDHALTQLGEHWALTHVADFPLLVYRRMKALWRAASPVDEEGMPMWRTFAALYPTLVILLAFVGLGMAALRRWRQALIPALFIAVVTLGAAVFYGTPRMRAPMEPML